MSASSMTLTPRIRRSAPRDPASRVAPSMQSRASASRTVIADSAVRSRPAVSSVMARASVAAVANWRPHLLARAAHDPRASATYSAAMPTTARTAVVAVGGNALLEGGGPTTIAEQFDAARRLAPQLCRLVADGWRIVLTHGNGPQVGFIMRRSDLVADIEPELPQLDLDMAVADSQGSLGYILGATLQGELRASGLAQQVVAMLTHTVVDAGDPAFGAPTKPIGSFYAEDVARKLAAQNGWEVAEDSGRGWRRLVASPQPGRIVEQDAIETLVEAGFLVVAAGGGGIPV